MNRLAQATSPYLLQHATNPVDWYPWGTEALAAARDGDRPILLSIGYAACHWCHVMERESFESETTARLMNTHFVNIKVDREERPDLDGIYMRAVQAMTGHGGWPMTVFLTPDGVPFYGGTYFPPDDRHGLPAFPRVLAALAHAWQHDRDQVLRTGEQLRALLSGSDHSGGAGSLSPHDLTAAFQRLAGQYDDRAGGFGGAPKFPPLMPMEFLLTHHARGGDKHALAMVHHTFRQMVAGGLHDLVGGGIHRYSVDDHWLVPHFEKMLYDNALFVRTGVHLWQATGDPQVRAATERAVDWILREMTDPLGGFYSSLDADSEGHEGRFYVWDTDALRHLLGDAAEVAILAWGVTREGNFEGANILHEAVSVADVAVRLGVSEPEVTAQLERARVILLRAREQRIRPALDDKVLASWNGLMLRALTEAGYAFGRADYLYHARRNAEFLANSLMQESRVFRSWRAGHVLRVSFLEDQCAVALGFIELYGVTGEARWLELAQAIGERTLADFCDADGTCHDTPHDHEALIARPSDEYDNATPSGASLLCDLLLRLGDLGADARFDQAGRRLLLDRAALLIRHPMGFGHYLTVADMAVYGPVEIRARGVEWPPTGDLSLAARFIPSRILDPRPLADTGSELGLQVCRDHTCHPLAPSAAELARRLAFPA